MKKFFERNRKLIFKILGFVFFFLGIIGIPLPLLPTTPFMLLSAYCFSQSSEELHQWLRNHKIAGPIIRDWEDRGAISKKTKILSVSMLWIFISYPLIFMTINLFLKIVIICITVAISVFIITRPNH